MSDALVDVDHAPEIIRSKIKVSWRSAIFKAWKQNGREYILKSVIVSSIASILRMLQGFVVQGFILWLGLGTVMFLLHISEDVRLQRKTSRFTSN
jgi:hypothetical protein